MGADERHWPDQTPAISGRRLKDHGQRGVTTRSGSTAAEGRCT